METFVNISCSTPNLAHSETAGPVTGSESAGSLLANWKFEERAIFFLAITFSPLAFQASWYNLKPTILASRLRALLSVSTSVSDPEEYFCSKRQNEGTAALFGLQSGLACC